MKIQTSGKPNGQKFEKIHSICKKLKKNHDIITLESMQKKTPRKKIPKIDTVDVIVIQAIQSKYILLWCPFMQKKIHEDKQDETRKENPDQRRCWSFQIL